MPVGGGFPTSVDSGTCCIGEQSVLESWGGRAVDWRLQACTIVWGGLDMWQDELGDMDFKPNLFYSGFGLIYYQQWGYEG